MHGTQLDGGAISLDQTGKKVFFCLGPNWSGFTMTPVVIPYFPCDTLLLEPGWMKTPYRMDGWSAERFPDPGAMIEALTRKHFKLGLWQCGPADWIFTSWDKMARKANQWGVDITDPAGVRQYKRFHAPYYDQGISFFKQDGCGHNMFIGERDARPCPGTRRKATCFPTRRRSGGLTIRMRGWSG